MEKLGSFFEKNCGTGKGENLENIEVGYLLRVSKANLRPVTTRIYLKSRILELLAVKKIVGVY